MQPHPTPKVELHLRLTSSSPVFVKQCSTSQNCSINAPSVDVLVLAVLPNAALRLRERTLSLHLGLQVRLVLLRCPPLRLYLLSHLPPLRLLPL